MGWGGRPGSAAVCAAVVALALPAATPARSTSVHVSTSCATKAAGGAFRARVRHALGSGEDIWGDTLLSQPGGPTLARVERFLPPLLYAVGHGGKPLTASGV